MILELEGVGSLELVEVQGCGVSVTSGSLRAVEDCLMVLAEAGFDPSERLHAFHSLAGFVVGISLFHFGFEEAAYVDFSLEPSEFPLMSQSLAELTWDPEHEFAFGLDALLAGLEAKTGNRTGKRSRSG